jgi:hypothetical protein
MVLRLGGQFKRARNARGDMPNQRLNARLKALSSE